MLGHAAWDVPPAVENCENRSKGFTVEWRQVVDPQCPPDLLIMTSFATSNFGSFLAVLTFEKNTFNFRYPRINI